MTVEKASIVERLTGSSQGIGGPREPSSTPPAPYMYDDDILSLWTLAAIVVRWRNVAVVVALGVLLIGLPIVLLSGRKPDTYTASASFIPEGAAPTSAGAGLASRLGISIPGGAGSLPFYNDLLKSRTLLGRLTQARFVVHTGSDTATKTVAEIAGAGQAIPEAQTVAAVGWLRDHIRVGTTASTGVMTVEVAVEDRELALQLVRALIKELHEYNVSIRQSNAATERKFVEERLRQLRIELAQSEDALVSFLRENRQYENAPELRVVHDRLQRERTLKQEMVVSLSQSYEAARIQEVRNTPVLSMFEEPAASLYPDPRGSRLTRVIQVIMLAGFLGIVAALVSGLFARARQYDSAPYRDFETALHDVKRKVQRLLPRRA
jgi:uncharacterized protein involved in exopolysaccharide biosynthesis